MDVIIQSLGFKHSDNLEAHINEKLEKLTPSDRIIRANVTLFQGPDRATPNDYCEIRLEVPGPDLFVKEHSDQFEQAIDECINKLQGILRKQKEKWVDSHKRAGAQ
ncbi:MAG TPA: HPF/RaiA family ribosome-associated protein [Flavisolibacter sp.]|jgi:putative sigma-54 modulation protein